MQNNKNKTTSGEQQTSYISLKHKKNGSFFDVSNLRVSTEMNEEGRRMRKRKKNSDTLACVRAVLFFEL